MATFPAGDHLPEIVDSFREYSVRRDGIVIPLRYASHTMRMFAMPERIPLPFAIRSGTISPPRSNASGGQVRACGVLMATQVEAMACPTPRPTPAQPPPSGIACRHPFHPLPLVT